LKKIWLSNGIHHNCSSDKCLPEFSQAFFTEVVTSLPDHNLPSESDQTKANLISELTPIIFDIEVSSKQVNQQKGDDLVVNSANN
jgi:dipeptidyl-peptidase-3